MTTTVPVTDNKPLTSFHPLQCYRHFINRLSTLHNTRRYLVDEKAKLIKEINQKIKDLNQKVSELDAAESILMEEGRSLVPELRPFGQVYKQLTNIVASYFSK